MTTTTAETRIDELLDRYETVRCSSRQLCEPLEIEDYGVQSMPDCSPVKWHLAHTTWFFETFVLAAIDDAYRPFHPRFGYLFNSYYEAVGERHARPRRGLLTRPTVTEVFEYRAHVDEGVRDAFARGVSPDLLGVMDVGLHHEQQHQELLLTDLKHLFSCNPIEPAYCDAPSGETDASNAGTLEWVEFAGGITEIGHGGDGFAFDNEGPRHRALLQPFALANRLVTNEEYAEFVADDGYSRPEFWLSDGWGTVLAEGWTAPLYWRRDGNGAWTEFTMHGRASLDPASPVCHVSHFEADAYARWKGARLPTEQEWEHAASNEEIAGHFVEDALRNGSDDVPRRPLHPVASLEAPGVSQLFGDAWEWTSSPYVAYPGYRPLPGALGEYNGKFMCNQMVLRGGSCATPRSHVRPTYRNFFPSNARWQFTGIRLARDLDSGLEAVVR